MTKHSTGGDVRGFVPPRDAGGTLESLRESGVNFDFPIEGEKSIDGQDINAKINWVRFRKPEGAEFADLADVEGKLYEPSNPNGELIIFTPGFPGGNAGRFEQRYAKAFTDAGYAFFTVRHNGASLTNGSTSLEILNSQKRMDMAVENGEHHIGGTKPEGYSPAEIANETVTPLMRLASKYEKIHLMGQSMGVASSFNALRRTAGHPEVTDKIGNVVGISGYVGGTEQDPKTGLWDGIKMPMDAMTEYEYGYVARVDGNIVPQDQYTMGMKQVAAMNDGMIVPEHVNCVLAYTPEDPLIKGPGRKHTPEYGPKTNKKLIIRDEAHPGAPKPHSMLWIKPDDLIWALKVQIGENGDAEGPHYMRLTNESEVE